MRYHLSWHLSGLKTAGNYGEFIDIERQSGQFPKALRYIGNKDGFINSTQQEEEEEEEEIKGVDGCHDDVHLVMAIFLQLLV